MITNEGGPIDVSTRANYFKRSRYKTDLDERVAILVNHGERPMSHVFLDIFVIKTTADQTLSIEDGHPRVHGSLCEEGMQV